MHGISLGRPDLAASRAMKTTRVGGGHPDYKVLSTRLPGRRRAPIQQDLWHYTLGKMVDACAAAGIKPFYGPFGDFSDRRLRGAVPQRLPDGLRRRVVRCIPTQSPIAKRVFSPDPAEVAFAEKILAAMPDGSGAVMIDGKMQDDATWKQAKVCGRLARLVAAKDAENGPEFTDYGYGATIAGYRAS
jgi:malyl-CoA/(S)-citramalyl-CoA lyase